MSDLADQRLGAKKQKTSQGGAEKPRHINPGKINGP
jgi:hypothetical protein